MDNGSGDSPGDTARRGAHPDPTDPATPPPDRGAWTPAERRAWDSPAMELFRAGLRPAGGGRIREGVLDDLTSHHGLTRDECVRRCVGWEAWSVREWQAAPRDSPEAIADFYRDVRSWSFDLLWYAYLQAEGYGGHASVTIAGDLPWSGAGRRHLDFGSGVGTTSQLFARLGFESDLGDISATLLAFARHRLERRGEQARLIDLDRAALPADRYDVVTAIDTLAHVADLPAAAAQLHAAMRPGGLLYANLDVRPRTPENAWHLYDDDRPLRLQLQRAGFEPEAIIDRAITRYRRVAPAGLADQARLARDTVVLGAPAYGTARRAAKRLVRRIRGTA